MDLELATIFAELKIDTTKGSASFVALLQSRYPTWSALEQFAETLPAAQVKIELGDWSYCYLWPESWIIDAVNMSQSNKTFLPVGSLINGSILAINTASKDPFHVGAFAFEKTVHLEDEHKFRPSCFRKFPFSYPEYLRYILTVPSECTYF
jgi:hypothetical protein